MSVPLQWQNTECYWVVLTVCLPRFYNRANLILYLSSEILIGIIALMMCRRKITFLQVFKNFTVIQRNKDVTMNIRNLWLLTDNSKN